MSARTLVLTLALYAAVPACADQTNPLSKVIDLLDSLSAKITKEGEVEAKAFKDYFEWCDDASKNLNFEIKTAESDKAKLEAKISEAGADSDAAATKIDELAASIASGEADLKNATGIRTKEKADFDANEAELVATIDTLTRAISILQKEMAKNPAAFTQIDTSKMDSLLSALNTIVDAAAFSTADKQKLTALVQEQHESSEDDEETGAPAATVYKTHSSNIFDVLEDLKEKAEEELSGLRKAETSAKHNYEMLKQSLEDQAKDDAREMDEQKALKSDADSTKATAEGDLANTVKSLAQLKSNLEIANANCMQVAADHDATVKAREEELKVIAEAKGLLTSTTTGAETQTYSFLQTKMQTKADLANAEVFTMVKNLARKHHSAALAQLASRIQAVIRLGGADGDDPFKKVKSLISDLITRLEKEADADATEKAYCDEQMAKTEAKKSELEGVIAKLTAKIDQSAAASATLKDEVKALEAALAALAKEQAEMDKIRQETHAAYVTAKSDLELGLQGVRGALGVLREYYGAASLVQASFAPAPPVPELHSKATGAGTSIIGILEVVESDFAKNLAAEETQEADAQAEYEKESQANEVEKTMKEQDVKYKTQEFVGLDKKIAELSGDRDTTNTELAAVLEYYGKIKERCIAKPETYEERKRRREAEIAGLKEALTVLESETAFVQRKGHGMHQFLSARQ